MRKVKVEVNRSVENKLIQNLSMYQYLLETYRNHDNLTIDDMQIYEEALIND